MRRLVPSGLDIELIQQHLDELLALLALPAHQPDAGYAPPVDLREDEEGFVVLVDVPGVAASDLVITLRQRELRIAGRKLPTAAHSERRHCHHMERGFGTFSVDVLLPAPVRPEVSRSKLAAGVLEIRVPRVSERRDSVHTIAVAEEET